MVQVLTLARIPLAILVAALLLPHRHLLHSEQPHPLFQPPLPLLALLGTCVVLLILIELTDLFDGRCARRFGVVTEWGAMLDPYADSVTRITVYWTLAVAGLALPLVPLVMACRDLTVAYCRVILAQHGKSVSAKWSGKIKACFQGVGGIVLLLGPLYWPFRFTGPWIMTAGSWLIVAVTFASLIEYLRVAFTAVATGHRRT